MQDATAVTGIPGRRPAAATSAGGWRTHVARARGVHTPAARCPRPATSAAAGPALPRQRVGELQLRIALEAKVRGRSIRHQQLLFAPADQASCASADRRADLRISPREDDRR
jgi:hypothetical protein